MSKRWPKVENHRVGWPWTEDLSRGKYSNSYSWPRLSIVTPSYNQGEYIEETIRSVLLQNYPNLQYIVIDGGSTDNTVEIIEKYSQWIDYWVSEPDSGQSDAIRKGLSRCNGKWFNWVNSDDYLKLGALISMVEAAESSNARMVSGVTENTREEISFSTYSTSLATHREVPFFSVGVNQPGSLLRLEDVKLFGGVREDLALCMDLDLWLKVLLKHSPQCHQSVTETVAAYRYHADSKTCSADDAFALEEFSVLSDLYESLSKRSLPPTLKRLRDRCQARKERYKSDCLFDPGAVENAYFNRLIVEDSLLFRAIVRTEDIAGEDPFGFLRLVLQEIQPKLKCLYGSSADEIESVVWLRAMQHKGHLDMEGSFSVLKNKPELATVREIARIAVRGNKA